ncbi:MAG TPA: LPS export ABC transporter periplasmic protein LptC [Acidiferrobacterales bacterium]|nr:LPS export ABC transporter periplasmic protein LptC [Acidiferrobacterales bacterium]
MTWDITRIVIVMSLLVFTGLFWWLPQALTAPAMKFTGIKSRDPDYYIENFGITAMSERGKPKYILKGTGLVHFLNEENTRIDQPYLMQYEQTGAQNDAPTITTADIGWISADGNRLLMSGNVKVLKGPGQSSASAEITANQLVILLN